MVVIVCAVIIVIHVKWNYCIFIGMLLLIYFSEQWEIAWAYDVVIQTLTTDLPEVSVFNMPHLRWAYVCKYVLISAARNQPLRKNNVKWKSETPLTLGQLYSRRDEFWETAPAFEGRKEIWDGLRAAVVAAEQDDLTLAQAILDGANIFIPNG